MIKEPNDNNPDSKDIYEIISFDNKSYKKMIGIFWIIQQLINLIMTH